MSTSRTPKRKMRIYDSDTESEETKGKGDQNLKVPKEPEDDIAKNYREDVNNIAKIGEVSAEKKHKSDKGEVTDIENKIKENPLDMEKISDMEQVTDIEKKYKEDVSDIAKKYKQNVSDIEKKSVESVPDLAFLPLKDLGEPLKKEKIEEEAPPEEIEDEKKKTPKSRQSVERKRKRPAPADDDEEYEDTEEISPKKKVRPSPRKTPTQKSPKTPKKEKKSNSEEESDSKKKKSSTPKKKETKATTPRKRKSEETENKETTKVSKLRSSKSKNSTNEEEDEEEQENDKTPTKKTSAKKKTTGKRKKTEEELPSARKWWEEDENWRVGKKKTWKWRTLEHTGVYFTPAYVPHGVKLIYDGAEVDLTPEQEEWATYFVRYLESDHMKKEQFSRNFFTAWKELLGEDHVVEKFEKCDFRLIQQHVKDEQEKRKNRTPEEKEREKKEKASLKEKHGYAIIDGHREAIANFTVEPPGLFLGRGQHPKAGMFKQRVMPEQVTLNMTEGAEPPECPIPGHNWGSIVHNHEVTWLASWRENVNNQNKYVLFSAQSSLRGRSDRMKFETARRLKDSIKKIRKDYMKNLKNKEDMAIRQRATAMWVIDRLALRVGNDKGKDEADTVGCCSLRVEHVKLHPNNEIEFDFLGKDSMRYHNRVQVIPEVLRNFQIFMKGKSNEEQIFDRLNPPQLNAHLQALMDGLTAKVFRTYNASFTMQQELAKFDDKDASVEEKVLFFNSASVQVAVLCNHQRTVSKTHQVQMGKMDEQIQEAQDEIKEVKAHIKRLKEGKEPKKRKSVEGEEEKKPFSTNPDVCERRIGALKEKIRKLNIKKKEKDTLKEVSTSTSKVNYIDPRISVAWCMKQGVDIKKIFAKTMRDKFAWAIAEVENNPDFVF